jgi:hypothetical protein
LKIDGYMNVEGFLPGLLRPCNHMNGLQGSVKQSSKKHPITTSEGRAAICIPALGGEHYKKTTLQKNSEIIHVVKRICKGGTKKQCNYLQDAKIKSCRTLRIAQIHEERLLTFIPKLVQA